MGAKTGFHQHVTIAAISEWTDSRGWTSLFRVEYDSLGDSFKSEAEMLDQRGSGGYELIDVIADHHVQGRFRYYWRRPRS